MFSSVEGSKDTSFFDFSSRVEPVDFDSFDISYPIKIEHEEEQINELEISQNFDKFIKESGILKVPQDLTVGQKKNILRDSFIQKQLLSDEYDVLKEKLDKFLEPKTNLTHELVKEVRIILSQRDSSLVETFIENVIRSFLIS